MTDIIQGTNAGLFARFPNIFKPRDIFLHDGKSLRRFTIAPRVQMAAAFVALVLFAWSAFATFQAIALMNGDVAHMQARLARMEADVETMRTQTRNHAALLERRQAFLAQVLSGEAKADELAALLPRQEQFPHNPLSQSYAQIDGMQQALAERAQNAAVERYQAAAQALRRLGVNPSRFHSAGAVGGPFEAVDADNADPRFRELFVSWRKLEQLEQGVTAIPSARPLRTSSNFTSGFGVRSDPFRGRAAMHGGVDLAGPVGTPIYATADGIVARSEWNSGGYGNLVEINHGQGIQTRYGHLSRLVARAGQRVRRGDLIGLMGSTGRSTGSHLHYEVRIDGRAVNPIPFMQSNDVLVALQERVERNPSVAVGGPTSGAR
ncbi:M23 family metallopeptidase [Sphingosinicella sp. CPCC 101087]|uniref:M23 family metallopeptidase n=1 Tax=Sphingosinicella sp. CPCC 101087 TaxID=2497754 RepID=UPI00101DE481|nr:M23 family metallopeptidase [Sphingosinicella sp. CPCC 101087]